MRASHDLGRIPTRRVWMIEIADETDDEIIAAAMDYTGESKSSLFGWSIQRAEDDPTTAVVLLFTD